MDLKRNLVLLNPVILYFKQGDRESAKREVESLARNNKWELKDVYGCLLCLAASYGEIEAAEFCRDKGADLDYKGSYEGTPLCFALWSNHPQMAESLRKWGARKDVRLSSPSEREPSTFDYLKQDSIHGGFSKKMSLYSEEIFLYVKQGDGESAEKRVESLVRKNKWEPKDVYGYLLCAAASHGEIGVAEFCKDKGADLDCEDQYRRTPLWLASRFNHVRMAESLREWGACKDFHPLFGYGSPRGEEPATFNYSRAKSIYGGLNNKMSLYWEEIFLYFEQDDRESAERRVEGLARNNQWELKDVYSYLLHVAARNGKIEVAEFCKDKGADLDGEDQYGRTPLWLALRFNHVQMAESLRRWGASRGAHAVLQWGYTYHGEEKNAVQLSMEVIFSNIKKDVEQGNRERRIENLTGEKNGTIKHYVAICYVLLPVTARLKLLSFVKTKEQILITRTMMGEHRCGLLLNTDRKRWHKLLESGGM